MQKSTSSFAGAQTGIHKKFYAKKHRKISGTQLVFYLIAVLMIIAVLYPLWFVIIASFSNPNDVALGKVWLWPKHMDFRGYEKLFEQRAIWHSYFNTIL